ncbi:unnamed protein product [Cuscuta epithymum]|uniref:Hexosyltransferase n=1 Tax=Cuscuta epithymum TaxID=186058 RepID=A0AAV0FZG4_9ASTE|nr:unnamed protein product [Cuscuta epithymum]
MVSKPPLTKPKCFMTFLIFFTLLALYLTFTDLHYFLSPHHLSPRFNLKKSPSWYAFLANELMHKKMMRIGLVDVKLHNSLLFRENVDIVNVKFRRVSQHIKWSNLFPEWIDEDSTTSSRHKCPTVPMPDPNKYSGLDVVIAKAPCGDNKRDVYKLQVNLVVSNLVVRSGTVYVVFIGKCEPMFEILGCEDLLWNEEDVRIYKPNFHKLKQKVDMPMGSCQLARPVVQHAIFSNKTVKKQREAYVTVLHSSEKYVCGAIALGQSIIQSNSTKDLVLLADSSISAHSLAGLRLAGWTTAPIERIRSPHAARDAYNEWNYSKLRIWEKLAAMGYDKAIFVDSDIIVVKNMDAFFSFPELSAAGNDNHLFNSGVMVLEPSTCTFKALMERRYEVASYNGGDQGFLNEMFVWWHRLPMGVNRLKVFANHNHNDEEKRIYVKAMPNQTQTSTSASEHRLPEDVYAIHYLGLKPWACYRDYDCNWDRLEYHKFASDSAHEKWWAVYEKMPKSLQKYCGLSGEMDARIRKWRRIAMMNGSFPDEHWRVDVKDPRRLSFTA